MRDWKNQRGAVSIVSVSFVCLLLSVLVVSMVSLMTGENRQSLDAQDSTVSYYGAQGAAEDAAFYLRKGGSGGASLASLSQGCDPGPPAPKFVSPNPNIRCVKIDTFDSTVSSTLGLDSTTSASQTFDLTNSVLVENSQMRRLVLSWDKDMPANTAFGGIFGQPYTNQGNASAPPVMEVTIVNYFPGRNTGVDHPTSGTLIFSPTSKAPAADSACPVVTAGANQTYDYNSCYYQKKKNNVIAPMADVFCTGAVKRCHLNIDNITPLPGERTVVRLTTHFRSAQFTLNAYADNPPGAVGVTCVNTAPDSDFPLEPGLCKVPIVHDAQIRVTASVGTANRDVILSVPSLPGVQLGHVLFGENDICKGFVVEMVSGTEQVVSDNTTNCWIK